MTARLTLVHAGPHSSIQDGGRPGLMRFGVPASGPMDRSALALANAALGNPPGAAGLEVSLGGLTLDCTEGSLSLAVAGGGFRITAGARKVTSFTVFALQAGERLTIRPGEWGSWCCVAFAGSLVAQRWLGSAATHAISGFGGGMLRPGAMLRIEGATLRPERHGPIPPMPRPPTTLRLTIGPQDRHFGPEALAALTSDTFQLTDACDRMGLRLSGPSLRPEGVLDMPSEPILRGAVQVAGDGVATVLLADHQTTGGYPKIATLLPADLDALVQLRPKDQIRFRAISPAEAISLTRAAHADLTARLAALAAPAEDLTQRLLHLNLIGGAVTGNED